MTDIDDIIEYIKSLKKGFDKELFQSNINELAYIVDNNGLDYESFHVLFRIWLNLSIPISKWISLGVCLVPRNRIMERTVEYSLRWLMANIDNQANFPRIGFVLDWLTVAMDCDCIDMNSLDYGYEIFYTMLSYEGLTAHCLKLVYTLTKPADVTRRRALGLLNYAKKREGKKNMYRQLLVLLGLFKSYRPECVPNDVPSFSIHSSFRKFNPALVQRFRKSQIHQNNPGIDHQRLFWVNLTNSVGGRSNKPYLLIPNMEFVNVGSNQYADDSKQKTYLDFSDPVSLLRAAVQQPLRQPARLRALLCNTTGMALLALAPRAEQAQFSQDLLRLLSDCFLEMSPHSYEEKQDWLRRLATLQSSLLQGLPALTAFLAVYLPFWNERDYYAEILDLVEWISVENTEDVSNILDCLCKVYLRSEALEQCAILKAVTNMYTNLVYGSTRRQHYFINTKPSHAKYSDILTMVTTKISDMCDKGLQCNPDDMRLVYSAACSAERRARAAASYDATLACAPAMLTHALPILAPSAALLDKTAQLLLMYKAIAKEKTKPGDDPHRKAQKKILVAYTFDWLSCLHECWLTGPDRSRGWVFRNLHPQVASKLEHMVPNADASFSMRNHLALLPYTHLLQLPKQGQMEIDSNILLLSEVVVEPHFPNLGEFVRLSTTP